MDSTVGEAERVGWGDQCIVEEGGGGGEQCIGGTLSRGSNNQTLVFKQKHV